MTRKISSTEYVAKKALELKKKFKLIIQAHSVYIYFSLNTMPFLFRLRSFDQFTLSN